jgi:hypothetical protein
MCRTISDETNPSILQVKLASAASNTKKIKKPVHVFRTITCVSYSDQERFSSTGSLTRENEMCRMEMHRFTNMPNLQRGDPSS